MNAINAGDLNERVALQSASKGYDTNRQPTLTWSTFTTRRAKVEPVPGGSDKKVAAGKEATVTYAVLMRRYGFVAHDNRAVWNGRTFEIVEGSIVDDKATDSTTFQMRAVKG